MFHLFVYLNICEALEGVSNRAVEIFCFQGPIIQILAGGLHSSKALGTGSDAIEVDLRAECKKLEDELGMKKGGDWSCLNLQAVSDAGLQGANKMDGKGVATIENEFSRECVFVERVKSSSMEQ